MTSGYFQKFPKKSIIRKMKSFLPRVETLRLAGYIALFVGLILALAYAIRTKPEFPFKEPEKMRVIIYDPETGWGWLIDEETMMPGYFGPHPPSLKGYKVIVEPISSTPADKKKNVKGENDDDAQ